MKGLKEEKVVHPEGWRGSIGLIIPTVYTTHPEHESRYLLPEGVGLICQRVLLDYPGMKHVDAFNEMNKALPDAANILKSTGVDVISFCCTISSFLNGRDSELQLIAEIEKLSDLPFITVAGAVSDAIRFLGVKKVLLVSPYPSKLNLQLEKYLKEDQGIGIHFLYEIVSHLKTATPWQQFQVVIDAFRTSPPGADAIFFSCGALRLVEVIPSLEEELEVPVLSSNLCNIWKCLQVLGIHSAITGKGKLLEMRR
ncbi:putative Maleate cis-trans isomerase [uncultured Desulfobacterium sp.]|uniref:Putative Maleate cis-trans isomerase n=1 Tax=uncultured Desulfobacterium sp. TaxID=201089 RepID=A0A445MXH9_9BACT|nr:putative Maleate cis-trans isomerase [uncultured Desulfobacterium sp.]